MAENISRAARPAHLGWRLLALVYDFFPNLAIWAATSGAFLLLRGGHPVEPNTLQAGMELFLLWAITGTYAVFAWRRGGQTLGMQPWRLKVVGNDGLPASVRALCLRYAVATLSLLAVGLGFLWALVDRDRRTWHDLASGTVMVRLDKPAKK